MKAVPLSLGFTVRTWSFVLIALLAYGNHAYMGFAINRSLGFHHEECTLRRAAAHLFKGDLNEVRPPPEFKHIRKGRKRN